MYQICTNFESSCDDKSYFQLTLSLLHISLFLLLRKWVNPGNSYLYVTVAWLLYGVLDFGMYNFFVTVDLSVVLGWCNWRHMATVPEKSIVESRFKHGRTSITSSADKWVKELMTSDLMLVAKPVLCCEGSGKNWFTRVLLMIGKLYSLLCHFSIGITIP